MRPHSATRSLVARRAYAFFEFFYGYQDFDSYLVVPCQREPRASERFSKCWISYGLCSSATPCYRTNFLLTIDRDQAYNGSSYFYHVANELTHRGGDAVERHAHIY